MDEIRTLEAANPVHVGIRDIPFTKCDWAAETVVIVVSFCFSETGRGIVSNAGSEVWIRIKSVIQSLQQSAGPHERLVVNCSLEVSNKAFVSVEVTLPKVFAALPTQISG